MSAERLLPWILFAVFGCASLGPPRVEPFRVSDAATLGDPTRRASTRLVLRGLDADVERDLPRAESLYLRALQVDPTNPYGFLALARHAAQRGQVEKGLSYADQALTLLRLEQAAPGAELHVRGLQGALGAQRGDRAAEALLAQASRGAPQVWDDGQLDASELR